MEHALEKLGLSSLDDVTPDSLKRAFKSAVVNAHPDKGGSDDDFESILNAYVHLSAVIKRMSGGRNGFQILDPTDVKQSRDDQFTNELNNLVSEIFDQIDHGDHSAFQKEFNAQFEKLHVRENDRGYEEWFRSKIDQEDQKIEESDPETWNRAFESNVKLGKPEPTTLILHPEQMGLISGPARGAMLLSTEQSFTSDPDDRPEYTDLHDAYTSENTVFDKVPVYQEKPRTFEELLKERDMVYVSELDRDLEAIAAYEKRKQEEEKEHKQHIEAYFKGTSSSVWALRSAGVEASSNSFVKEFK